MDRPAIPVGSDYLSGGFEVPRATLYRFGIGTYVFSVPGDIKIVIGFSS